jgi:hypothetical protein
VTWVAHYSLIIVFLFEQDREIALKRMSQAGAFLTTAQSAAFMLMQTADHENFKTVSKLTVDHMKLPNEFNEALTGKL